MDNLSLKSVVLFDIDGTIADISCRRRFLEGDSADWKSFNEGMGGDVVNEAVVSLYRVLFGAGVYEVILVTGRMEGYRELTEQWLVWNDVPFTRLIMRGEGDYRADYLVKEEILEGLQKEGKEILFVVDDRQQVVDMWRRHGITCLQCDVGDF